MTQIAVKTGRPPASTIDTRESAPGNGKTILIVEDDKDVRHMIRQSLQRTGFRPTCAERGHDAIEKVNGCSDVLLLLDCELPDMTGRQVVERLLETQRRVPFIAMSNHRDERTAVEMMKLGARDYIVKDRGFATLLPQVVGRVVREVSAEQEQAEKAARLRESHRSLSSLVRNLPGMAYRCRHDSRRTMVFASDGCLELTGYRPSDIVDNNRTSYMQLLHVDDRATVFNHIQTALSQKLPFHLTYRIRTANETGKWLWEKGAGVFSADGRLLCIEGFIADFTRCKDTEETLAERTSELERANRELEVFADRVSASISVKGKLPDEPRMGRMARHKSRPRDTRDDVRALRLVNLREVSAAHPK